MSPLDKWMFRRICRKQVRQGYDHPQRITEMYRMIYDAARDEFREDNDATAREYLTEWFEAALSQQGGAE